MIILELTFVGAEVEGWVPPVRARWEQGELIRGRGWLRDQKQEGRNHQGAAANSRLSLSSKLLL